MPIFLKSESLNLLETPGSLIGLYSDCFDFCVQNKVVVASGDLIFGYVYYLCYYIVFDVHLKGAIH